MSKQQTEPLFAMSDYRFYVRIWAQSRGRGEFRRIAISIGMHTTLVSQVFSGKKRLTEEQASNLCAYMGLNSLEADYFLKLVQLERAGTERLKNTYRRHLQQIRNQASEIRSRVPESKELGEQDRAIFYSSWQYSLIRLLTSVEQYQTPEKISRHLKISLSRVQEILGFLTSRGLCVVKNGRYNRTSQNTHIEAQSPLAIRHHQNWRTKCLEMQEHLSTNDLVFTAPVSLSKGDFDKVRGVFLNAISEISKIVENSPPEDVAYLGIDWIGMSH